MKYLVMESRPSYAVVLDEEGRFLKVANLGYQVGQRVDTVIGFQEETSSPARKWVPLVSLAACLCLMLLFHDILISWAGGTDIVYYIIFGLTGVNFLLELVIILVLSTVIVRVVSARKHA